MSFRRFSVFYVICMQFFQRISTRRHLFLFQKKTEKKQESTVTIKQSVITSRVCARHKLPGVVQRILDTQSSCVGLSILASDVWCCCLLSLLYTMGAPPLSLLAPPPSNDLSLSRRGFSDISSVFLSHCIRIVTKNSKRIQHVYAYPNARHFLWPLAHCMMCVQHIFEFFCSYIERPFVIHPLFTCVCVRAQWMHTILCVVVVC